MKLLQNIVVFIFFCSLIKSEVENTTVPLSNNITDSINSTNETNETHHSNRLIKISFVEMDFITFDPLLHERSKFQLMPLDPENNGVVYLDVKQRGFKFTFRKKAGIPLKTESDQQPAEFLERIFKPYIGQYNMTDLITISSIRLYQPMKDHAPFEFSQLKDQCWRLDIYPDVDTNCEAGTCKEYSLNLKFCVKKHDDNLTVRKYGYLLEGKELDHTNKE